MNGLFIVYSALAVFGLGVTVVDLFGVFEHAGSSDDAGGDIDDAGGDSDDTAGDNDDAGGDHADSGHHVETGHNHFVSSGHEHGSYVASADSGTRLVAKAIGTLRMGVYFSLGAGPTGLFAILTGVNPVTSLAWSAGAGLFIALLARTLRKFIRNDLDSSIKPAEYIMDMATISVPLKPGTMGKAIVRSYGRQAEIYVRSKETDKAFPKGSEVRIIDFDDDCYWIESL